MKEINPAELEAEITRLKTQIMNLGPMRPGSLSIQYQNRAEKKGAFHQLSYTFKGRSRSESVKKDDIERIKKEVENFQTFKKLCDELITASLIKSRGRAI